jgi:hypothetical protein
MWGLKTAIGGSDFITKQQFHFEPIYNLALYLDPWVVYVNAMQSHYSLEKCLADNESSRRNYLEKNDYTIYKPSLYTQDLVKVPGQALGPSSWR